MESYRFRGWSEEAKCFCSAFSVHQLGTVSDMIDAEIDKDSGLAIADAHWGENDIEVSVYTGLFDVDLNEICIGDIVKRISSGREYTIKKGDYSALCKIQRSGSENFVIVGNVFEKKKFPERAIEEKDIF